jgi:hypothetical protein
MSHTIVMSHLYFCSLFIFPPYNDLKKKKKQTARINETAVDLAMEGGDENADIGIDFDEVTRERERERVHVFMCVRS